MKIGFLTHQFPGIRGGGIGTYVLQAARALAAAGHEPVIFTPFFPGDADRLRRVVADAGVQVKEVLDVSECIADGRLPPLLVEALREGGEAIYRLALGWLLCQEAREYHRRSSIDVIEAAEYEALGLPLMLRPEPGMPVVTHLHLCSAIARAGNLDSATAATPEDAKIDALETAAVQLADGVCAPTRYIVEETGRFLGVAAEALVIPYPMKLGGRAAALPETGPILFAGRLEPRKGSNLMAEAFNTFLSRNPEATIRLVGSDTQFAGKGGRAESVRGAITQRLLPEVRGRVEFAGELSPERVREEFARCRFSIVPSLMDNFPNSAAESLAGGRAVVAGDSTGTVEVVGEAGVTFPRGDAAAFAVAMERLWRDRALCTELSEKAVARTRSFFSVENTIMARVEFYRRVIANAGANESRKTRRRTPEEAIAMGLSILSGVVAAGVAAAYETPGARLLGLMEKINSPGARIYLYGAGRHTARLMTQRDLWESRGHRIVGLIDDHPRFATSPTHLGLPVQSVQAAANSLAKGDVVILSTDTFQDQFWMQTESLRAAGTIVLKLYD